MFPLWTYLWNHVFKRLHDSGTLAFLIVGKDSGDYDDCRQYNAQVQLRKREHTTKLSSFYTSVVRLSRQTTLAGSPWPVPRCMTRCDTHKWEFTTKWSDHVSNYSITCWQEVPLCFIAVKSGKVVHKFIWTTNFAILCQLQLKIWGWNLLKTNSQKS